MDTKNLELKIDSLKQSIETLILIELCKSGVTRDQARNILGGISNEAFAAVNKAFNSKSKTNKNGKRN